MEDGRSAFFSGANQYYLFYKSRAMTDDVLTSAANLGLNVIRTWAFCDGEWHDGHSLQPQAGVFHEETFKNLDYAIYRAEQLGIRLVFTLVNNWDAFGGMNTYVKWTKTAKTHDDFYSDPEARALFKAYIAYVLNRKNTYTGRYYKDDPTILMWELANEPRVDKTRVQDLYSWVHEMAGFIKNIDPKHLVSTGSEGDQDTDLYLTHESPHIDVVSFHLYPEDWSLNPEKALNYIKTQIKTAKEQLRKPIFCGEFGLRNQALRAETYREWYQLFKTNQIDGALFWLLSGRRDDGTLYPDFDGFTIYYPQSSALVPVIKDFSEWSKLKSGQTLDRTPPQVTIENWTDGTEVGGILELSGTVSDQEAVLSVVVDVGGALRPATVNQGHWHFKWDSLESLDRRVDFTVIASDLENNQTKKSLWLKINNQGYKEDSWFSQGYKEQDDGYNFIYFLTAKNQTKREESGHFKARFFLRPEGPIGVGTHYDASQTYQGNPVVSAMKNFYGGVHYFEVDFGYRSVEPGHYLGFKGQLSQADGKLKSKNDWSASDLASTTAKVQRVVWLKDGQVIAGAAP